MNKPNTKAEQIWLTVAVIPKGKVAAYGQIADLAGLPKRARFVSTALRLAPETMNLPWHRVLRSNGQLAFSAESDYARLQTKLLKAEGVIVINNRVNLREYAWQPELGELLAKLIF